MARRHTKGKAALTTGGTGRQSLNVVSDVEITAEPDRATIKVGEGNLPATATTKPAVRILTYAEECARKDAEKEAWKNRRIVPRFREERAPKVQAPVPLVPCPACGGDIPACRLCGGNGQVAGETASAWWAETYGDA